MGFVLTHRVATVRALLRAGWRAADRLRRLTPQQRADLYVSRMPVAVIAG